MNARSGARVTLTSRPRRGAMTFPWRRVVIPVLVLAGLLAPRAGSAASITGLRLLSIGKDQATLGVDLDAPAAVSISYGEAPGAWSATSESASESDHHELTLKGLSPDTRYFYQASVGGTPLPDVGTFRSGRSWVTRRALLLVTADAPQGADGEKALAARMFSEEADALVVLGATTEQAATLHARAAGDRLVLGAPVGGDAAFSVADVGVASLPLGPSGRKALGAEGTCWRVVLAPDDAAASSAPKDADVVIRHGVPDALERKGDQLLVTLSDPEIDKGARADLRLAFAEGKLEATLRGVDGATMATASLQHACAVPKSKEQALAPGEADEGEPGSSDADGTVSDCDSGG